MNYGILYMDIMVISLNFKVIHFSSHCELLPTFYILFYRKFFEVSSISYSLFVSLILLNRRKVFSLRSYRLFGSFIVEICLNGSLWTQISRLNLGWSRKGFINFSFINFWKVETNMKGGVFFFSKREENYECWAFFHLLQIAEL